MKGLNGIKCVHYLLTGPHKIVGYISSYILKMKKMELTQLELILTHSL